MAFSQLGQEWKAYVPRGQPRSSGVKLGVGEWAWVERTAGESGLCPVGEAVTIETATLLEDEDGNEIAGALERAALWETIAERRGLKVPKQPVRRRPKRTKRTKRDSEPRAESSS